MPDLILGVLCFNLILILFKFFVQYGVNNSQAITFNYFTAGSLGLWLSGSHIYPIQLLDFDWMPFAAFIGSFFILTFVVLATTTQKVGMAISTVANKMSVIIPVTFAFILYGDQVSLLKIGGIALALAGVFFTSTTARAFNFDKKYLPMILFIFLGQGIADVVFNYAQQTHVGQEDSELFICGMFYSAGAVGLLISIYQLLGKKTVFHYRNILWGIALGVPNYFTVFFFFRALESGFMESSQVYPIFNMSIIVVSALFGFLVYKEKLAARNWMGILFSVVAILAIMFG